jgi:polyisoprenoid-binding protein YceI
MICPRLSLPAALAVALAASACKQHDGGATAGSAAPTDPAAGSPGSGSALPGGPDDRGDHPDYVRILGHHDPAKPTDPVVIQIQRFRLVKAKFDPDDLTGGTADLELDLSSLDSGSAKRDKHLRSADMLDVDDFATAKIHVDNVKKAGNASYTADATVDVHGLTRKIPVTFDVLGPTSNGLRVKGTASFDRFDFAIGSRDDGVPIADRQDIEIELTLSNT